MFVGCWIAGLLAAGPLAVAKPQEELAPPPPLPEFVRLEVQPAEIDIADAHDSRQVLVYGMTKGGDRFDLTDTAKLSPDSDAVAIENDRYIVPHAAGKTTLTISAAGRDIKVPVTVQNAAVPEVRFVKDVMPILAKVGCNAGTCHGSQAGKNGFKLSLRGYDADYDFNALVNEVQGRRVDRVQPARSLMLLKPVGAVPHEGHTVLYTGTRHYQTVLEWVEQGARRDPQPRTGRPDRVEVLPAQIDLDLPGRAQRMIVIAHYPDGSTRDVTREAILSSNNEEVAKVRDNKVTAIRRGEAAVLVRYEGNYGAVGVAVMGDRTGFAWQPMEERNFIDTKVNAKLEQRKILPSAAINDADFVRRIYLDLTGVVPTGAQAREFLEDSAVSAQKREKLIDSLIGSRDFNAYWSNKFADLLQCNSKQLGENGVWAYREWIRQSIAGNKPYNKLVRELITAQGSSLTNPAVNYYRALKDRNDAGELTTNKMTEDISQTFLGVRFNCNKCHDHPFERWTQNQYYQFGAFFARVNFKEGRRPGEEIVFTSFSGGEVKHPKKAVVVDPRTPYGESPDLNKAEYRQLAFADWLTSEKNPLFAKSFVNRVWSYFYGRGIIEPVDDIRASNPAVNPELLDALTADFIEHGYDICRLMKTIVSSRTYQTSFAPNQWNEDDKINFSHAIPRRLSAEQMLDAVAIATGTKERVPGLPEDFRSVYLADGMVDGSNDFLKLFGRPKRETACECERTSNVSLAHALNLINGPLISNAVSDTTNDLHKVVDELSDNKVLIDRIYYMILNRPPTDAESASVDFGKGNQRLEVAQDLAWALLNSPAFLFNH